MFPGMKTHSDSSFDETKELVILRSLLESKKNIKTFFGENEKTPNHDGFFELVDMDTKQPKKQFVVQIKKANSLRKNKDNSYSFELDTPFLFYVKEKVAESPAIVFVVELSTKKCYYKYLSDEYLMQLYFETHGKIVIRLYDNDLITDIDSFYQTLYTIATERNLKFINKSPKQIEEIKTAVEWLNKAMEDIPFLKELIPNYWRFGIASSNNLPITITVDKTDLSNGEKANAFGLYLQCKNGLDYGVQNFIQQHYLKTTFDFTNTLTSSKYVQNVLISLLDDYFNHYIIDPQYLSDTVLSEIIFSMLDKMAFTEKCIFSKQNAVRTYYKDEESVETAKGNLLKFFSYFIHILNDDKNTSNSIKQRVFLNAIKRTPFNNPGADMIQVIASYAQKDFIEWKGNCLSFNMLLKNLNLFTKEYVLYCASILELEKRGIKNVSRIWDISNDDYKSSGIIKLTNKGIDMSEFTPITRTHGNSIYSFYNDKKLELAITKWISELPNEYSYCYKKIFGRNDTFKYNTNIKIKVIPHTETNLFPYWLELRSIKFDTNELISICYDETIPDDNALLDSFLPNIVSCSSGLFPIELFEQRLPFYNSIKIFLWQGIVKYYNLDTKLHGVVVGNSTCHLF